jgi:hypothetical protein
MALSIKEVRSVLLQLWPPGRLYDWSTPTSNVSRFLDALAETIKTFGFDVIDRLRREINPATAVEKLLDWEEALKLDASYTARNGTIVQRQAAVVGKLREFSALTLANVRASIAPLLGYADPSKLAILEVGRAAMRAAHTETNPQPAVASNVVSSSVIVYDGGVVSSAGVQVVVQVPSPPTPSAPLTFHLRSPTGATRTWNTSRLGSPATEYYLYDQSLVGTPCYGTWTLFVITSVVGVAQLSSWSIFVEGAGPSGLGGDIVDWGVYADRTLMGSSGTPPDLEATRAAIERI